MSGQESHSPPFSSEIAWAVLTKACDAAGLSADDAQLARLGQNAIFRLDRHPVVVRVGRSMKRMPIFRRELCVARWLHSRSVPVTRPYDELAHPIEIDGHPVSFWHAEQTGVPPPGAADLAALLRQMHEAGDSPCDLPALAPLGEIEGRLNAASWLPAEDRDFLRNRRDELQQRYDELSFELPRGPLHGDAHTGNLLGRAGAAILIDFEAAAIGPREFDLIPVAVAYKRLGMPKADYQAFAETYGFDVTAWSGFDVLRGIRELGMVTWLSQNVGESERIADEFAMRLRSLKDGDTREWHAF